MKNRLFSRSIAALVILSLLLTGSVVPIPATAVPVSVDSSENIIDNELITDEVVVLRTDDPIIAEESMILEYIDSAQFNAARHTQRLTELEDLNTYVFANADGTRSVYMMHENVKFIDESGLVVEKDISLTSEADGFGIARSDIDLLIPITPAQGIDMEYWGFDIKLTPQGISETTSAVQSNNSIVYDKAYGENTKLIYTPLLSGIKEDIVLTEYTDNASYRFLLKTGGLNVCSDGNGYYLADGIKEFPVFYLGDILIYDAIGKPDFGTLSVQTITEGQEYLLTVTANDDFLSDPTTVYPVTIDPSITISDSSASDSIVDAPIFQSLPTQSFGAFTYNRVGNAGGVYGVGRTVVKLSGLTSSSVYQSIYPFEITNVTFYAKEASGSGAHFINLYPLTGNTTWTESTVTWNNIGSYDTAVNYGNTMSYNQWTAFNITDLVKAWKSGSYSANAGFIMMNENEANDKCFCSSEFSASTNRPYVVLTYTQNFSLNYTNISVPETSTVTLVASTNPSSSPVTWSTNNSSVATVNNSGVVTTFKSGTVTITASMVDTDGVTQTATCHIYVYVTSGVYYIQNLYSGLYLHVENGGIDNFTDVEQHMHYDNFEDDTPTSYRIRQMWKVSYLGSGRYSVRPLSKLDMGLDVSTHNVDIYRIGTDDTLSGVPSYAEWTIDWSSIGYVFRNDGDSDYAMHPANASVAPGTTIVTSSYMASTDFKWTLDKISNPPSGAYWYDTSSSSIVSTATKSIAVGQSKTLNFLRLCAVAFDPFILDQTFNWSSSDSTVATVDSNGTVTGISTGTATITGRVLRGGAYHHISYTINVSPLLIYQTRNTYEHDKDGNLALDLKCGDQNIDQLRAMDWINWTDFITYTPALHQLSWEDMCTSLFSTGDLETVIRDMIDHFMDGTGTTYSNSVLTTHAYYHEETQTYINAVSDELRILLNTYDGDMSALAYSTTNRDSRPVVQALQNLFDNGIREPSFDTNYDKINGLTICVDSLWGHKIEVTSYSTNGNSYTCTLHYTLYDHFGLNPDDININDEDSLVGSMTGSLAGFRSWYILQHYDAYNKAFKPFLTLMEFDVMLTGTIS